MYVLSIYRVNERFAATISTGEKAKGPEIERVIRNASKARQRGIIGYAL